MYQKSTFATSCLRRPVNPKTKLPVANYEDTERDNNNLNSCRSAISDCSYKSFNNCSIDKKELNTLVNFYESIPDYDDIHHLPDNEFTNKLESLRERQFDLQKMCNTTSKSMMELDNLNCYDRSNKLCNSMSSLDINDGPKFSARMQKSVTIINSNDMMDKNIDADEIEMQDRLKFRRLKKEASKPLSFRKDHFSTPKLTVPKPFTMTQREEEEKMLADMYTSPIKSITCRTQKPIVKHLIPLTSRIPLMKSVEEDHKHKSELAKLNSSIELQSQMRPFTFSNPSPVSNHSESVKSARKSGVSPENMDEGSVHFKAKPCPKNLFSQYFYYKMWEDEYFRNLKKKIRAEELLKISSLPPSMAKRARNSNKRSKDSLSVCSESKMGHKRKSKRVKSANKRPQSCTEFITTSTHPFKLRTDKRSSCRHTKSVRSLSTSDTHSSCGSSMLPKPLHPITRPNLAATLRTEWVKKKMFEMSQDPNNIFYNDKYNKLDWGVKKTPAWKAMALEPTNDDDINMRLAARRAEEKLRKEEHLLNMQIMRERVRAAPLLLEGPTYWGPHVGQKSHLCKRDKFLKKRPMTRSRSLSNNRTMTITPSTESDLE